MKKLIYLILLLPILSFAQSDIANQAAIDSLKTNTAKKNNATFLWRLYTGLNNSKLNEDSAAFVLTTTGTSGSATYSGGTLNVPQYTSTLPANAAGLLTNNGSGILSWTGVAFKIVNIGSWNINGASTLDVTHGLSDISKIRGISIIIRNDAGDTYYDFTGYNANSSAMSAGIHFISSTVIELIRSNSSFFATDGAFDGTGFSRGTVTITYVP